ncbi:MAG: hypothetical protein IJX28_07080 [Clostridia bacterium]|nr:hypothetical protein [Clostridia bacterium]
MTLFGLLKLGECRLLPRVAEDLLPKKLFDETVAEILLSPCDAEEILARQALLAAFLEPKRQEALRTALQALLELERAHAKLCRAEQPLERFFLHARLLRAYLKACRALQTLGDCGPRGQRLAKEITAQAELETVEEILSSMEKELAPLQRFSLSVVDKVWLTADAPKTYAQRFGEAADALGLPTPAPRELGLPLTAELSQGVLQLHPHQGAALERLREACPTLDIPALTQLIPQFRFCFAICDLVEKARARNIPHCFPVLSSTPRFTAEGLYDISLLATDCPRIVPNDLYFTPGERFFFLTGANGGGKTSYLRAVGVNLLLLLAGCPVFARHAVGYPFSALLTHFPSDERFSSQGRLDEEKARVKELLSHGEEQTLVLLNETFSGADEATGCDLAIQTAKRIQERGWFGLFVTHFHRVREEDFLLLNTETGENHARTFRILRDFGLRSSFANTILKKYGLDEAALQRRG